MQTDHINLARPLFIHQDVSVCVYVYVYNSGLQKVREPGNRVPSHLAKVAARNHKSGCENHKVAARIINWLQDLVYTPAEVVSALRASVKVAVGSQPLFDF